MKVYFIGAGPGDPELLTLKAHRRLAAAECCIWAGSLINPQIMELVPPDCAVYDSAGMDLNEIISVIQEFADKNIDVIRLHTGEPAIFGAISEQMDRLDQIGIDYDVIPGISSFQAAAAALRTELTAPEVAQVVVLGRVAGRTPVPESQSLEKLAATGSTLCLFLSVGQIKKIASQLSGYYGPDCPAAVIYHASWPDQLILKGTLVDITEKVTKANITKTAMIIVGHALQRPLSHASLLYDTYFTHEFRQGIEK